MRHRKEFFFNFAENAFTVDTAANLLERYTFLLSILNNAGETGLTLAQIENKWNARFGSFQSRTFHRQREAIGEVFPVEIECTREGGTPRYRLRPSGDSSPSRRIAFASLNSFLLGSELSHDRLPMDRIYMSSSYGNRFATVFADGIARSCTVKFRYWRDRSVFRAIAGENPEMEYDPREMEDTDRIVEFCPYALAFETWWFVIGVLPGDVKLRVFALDRMKAAEVTADSFSPDPKFDYAAIRNNIMARYSAWPTKGGGLDDDDRVVFLTAIKNLDYVNIL